MSTLNIKKEFTLNSAINSILYCILGGLLCIAVWFIWFLYNNFFTTISRAETVLILKSELAVDVLDVPLYEKIKKNLEELSIKKSSEITFATSTPPSDSKGKPNLLLPKR